MLRFFRGVVKHPRDPQVSHYSVSVETSSLINALFVSCSEVYVVVLM